jgi:hypothetical protein
MTTIREVEDALDVARDELHNMLHVRSIAEKEKEGLDIKVSKLRVMQRQGEQHLRDLRAAPVVVASEFENVRNLTESARVEISAVHAQMAQNFQILAQNRLDISAAEKSIHDLTELLCKLDNNILEFPKHDVRRSEEED